MAQQARPSIQARLRRRVGGLLVDGFFETAARAGKLHPHARAARRGVMVQRDIPYLADGQPEHSLDLYRPADADGRLPVVLYVHGGGFRILSKDTHWVMGLAFARVGYAVVNISYRLAPAHPFPAALEDCVAALQWLVRHADRYGLDLERLVLAGESAGANLVTALAVACCYPRAERWAKPLWEQRVFPRALLPYCGMLQVSDPGRFRRAKPRLSAWVQDRLFETSEAYLGADPSVHGRALELADPLVYLERAEPPARPLPPCFAAVGTKDPLLPDTRRLQRAYDRLGAACVSRYYPGELHAFHAFAWREQARLCWRDTYAFLAEHLGVPAAV